jgi:hypothetical protein
MANRCKDSTNSLIIIPLVYFSLLEQIPIILQITRITNRVWNKGKPKKVEIPNSPKNHTKAYVIPRIINTFNASTNTIAQIADSTINKFFILTFSFKYYTTIPHFINFGKKKELFFNNSILLTIKGIIP